VPQECQPVKTGELEILEFATSFGDIIRVLGDFNPFGSRVEGVIS
jgi:hypothetical protein